ncbi:MAG: hypothetical protein ABS76_33500 [Pelagibacterium sp. SCN 64-44]|nr:MAG: hypothetical protein ABS76_33500 [Pelagibacterium sp. SCN 64-44]
MSPFKHRLPATLATARLALAAPALADVPAIARLCNNINVHKWMARLPFPYGEADARFFVEEIVPGPDELCYGLSQDGEFIGVVGLSFAGEQPPELGYWLGEPYWGKGYATEAARVVIEAARVAGIGQLRSRALETNAASRRVLRKAGFVETGTMVETANNLVGRQMVLMQLDFPS